MTFTHSSHTSLAGGTCVLALTLGLLLGAPGTVQAADSVNLDHGASAYYDDKGNLTIGDAQTVAEGKNQKGEHNTTIGTQTDTLRNVTEGDTKKDGQPLDGSNTILVDGEGKAHPLDLSTEAGGSTAVGYQNKAEGDNSTAIGNKAKITNKPETYYVDADGKKTASPENAVWYKDSSGNPTKVPQVFRDAAGKTTTTPQYVHTYTEKDPTTGENVTKTEITSDATKADQKDGQPVYNYQKTDNTPYLYTVTLYQAASNSIAAGTNVTANGSNAVAVGYNSKADNSAVAIGDTAEAKENAVAMGKDTKATAEGSIALGKGSEADRSGGVAGWDPKTGKASTKTDGAWQSGEGALSIGNGGASRQITNVAAGSEDSDAVNLAQLKNAMTHYYSVKTTAETDGKGNNNYLDDGATGDNALAAGVSAAASGESATAVGYNTSASGDNAAAFGSGSKVTDGGVAVGSGATASGGGVAFGSTGVTASSGGLAVGMYGTNASSNSAAFGLNSTTATNSSVAVGTNGTTANTSSFAAGFTSKAGTNGSSSYYGHNIAVGSNTTADNGSSAFGIDATANYQSLAIGLHGNSSSAYATNQSIAVGNGTNAFNFSTAIGNQAQAGNNGSYAVALGNEASALYDQTTAVGSGAKVISPYGTALGSGTSAAYYATALGNSASANYSYATAIGSSAQATDTNATAVGNGAKANKSGATALGYSASATDNYSTAVGDGAGAHGTSATALGNGASANSSYDTAIGSGAATGGGNGTALGYDAKAQSPYATALGSSAEASFHAIAIGDATASSSYALAAGDGANAQEYQAIALGYNAKSNVTGGVALGSSSTANVESGKTGLDPHTGTASTDTGTTWVSTLGAVSVGTVDSDGNATGTRQINGLAAGTKDTDAVNVAQLKALETRINMHYYSVNSTLSGDGSNYDNTGASGTNALAAGPMASASGEDAVAIGYGAQAKGKGATVIGQYGKATGRYALAFGGQQTDTTAEQADNVASGDNALSFGERTTASGTNSTAFGWQTTAKEKRATAFGERTTASGANATAFGQLATASGQNSVAFGNEVVANNYGSTAFGNRTEALGEYSTAFGNSTVAAGMNTAAFGTDNVAGAVLDENGAYTNIIYKTNNNGRVVKDTNGNPIELSREKMDARGNLAYLDGSGHTKSVTYTVPGGETHSYVLLQGTDGNTYIRDYRGHIRSATIGTDGTVTVGDTASADVTLKQATAGANGYHILSNANATVWGENSIASGEASTAFGVGSTAAAQNSLAALGGTVAASATNAAAIGKDAKANLADSVALGSGAVADRASGAKGYDMLTKGDTTNTSTAWVSNANAIAVGNGSTLTRQITGVAAGSQDTDAVNVAQLKAAGFKVTTQNDGSISSSILNGDTLDFEAKDNAIVSTSKDSKTITVAVSRTPTFDSATFYNPNPSEGQNNEKVTISNGHISTYNKDQQERAVLGTDNQGSGTLHLINNDLSQVHVYTQNSKDDGNDGITRMYYISSSGNGGEIQGIHTIAVLDDGINYAGDNVKPNTSEKVVVKHKLNSTMDITGGADTNNLAGGNIGVVATPAVEDAQGNITQKAKLELKLNKDLTGLNTVTAGTAKIGSAPADALKLTENGAVTDKTAPAGSYVTGLDNKDWSTTNPSYVSGRAATEDQLAAVSGTINKGLSFTTNTQDATNTTDNYTGYKVVNRKLGDTIAIKAGDADASRHYATTNLTTEIANNGDITIKMDESPTFTEVTASSFNLSPKDTTTKDKAGNTASAQLNAHYRDGSLNPDKNVTMADGSTGMVRLHYHDGEGTIHDLATMDDGQIYAGDIKEDGTLDTTGFGRKMNEKTTINGGVTNKDNLSDNNIGVVSDGTSTLTVKLAKNLKDLQSVQAGKTTINDDGVTIRKSDDDSSKNVIVLGDQVAFGDNQVNNMGSGADGTADGKPTYNTDTNGANIGDVKNIASSTVQPVIDTVNKGWELDVNSKKQKAVTPTSPKVNLIQGQNITITGDKDNTDNVTIATADDVRFNTVRVGGTKTGDTYSGGIVIGKQSGKNADGTESANSNDDYYITGLKNTNWDSNKIQSGRAATEDQLQAVATEIKNGTVKGDVFVTGGAVSYKGEGKGADPKDKDGTGSINLTRQNAIDVTIDGLHDYYVTGGTVTDDGKTLELTRNDVDGSGNPQKITVDLGNVLKNDQHLVTNPNAADGKYTVNTADGTVTLKVKNGDKYDDITIGGFEGLGQGLKFGANKMAKDGGGNPVTNQLGSTINVTGAGTKNLQDYSGKNLLTSVEQAADGTTTIHVLMDRNISADGVTVGQAGKDGVAGADGEVGQAGTIGINGKNGVAGTDGKQGITTTIIRTEKGQAGKDGEIGQQGAPGVDGTDITRIVYQNDQDKVDGKDGNHTVATLDDGLKFSGDDNKVITKKLNEQLQFVGGADKNKLTENNIGINELEDGKLTIQLVNTPNLGENGNLTAGSAQIGWFAGDTLDMTKDGTNPSGNKAKAGSYATGLSNKDWNVADPEYVSGRAATEDQLAKVSEAIGNATTAAGKRTVVTVNDKSNPAGATPSATAGEYGDYDSTGGNLMIAAKKDSDGVLTYNIKLNDQLAIGQKGEPGVAGKDGKDGKVTVETKGGTTVVIGHDGEPGKDGRDGLFVTGKDGADGKSGVSITGPNGAAGTDGVDGKVGIAGKDGKDAVSIAGKDGVGHIGLTGPKGEKGKDGISIDITTDLKSATLDDGKNVKTVIKDKEGKETTIEQAPRIQYKSGDSTYEVATMDDGLKFVGNDGKEVAKKLNSTLSLTGGITDATALQKASGKNIGVRSNEKGDGLEIVMTDTPDFTKVTVGGEAGKKITIGEQPNTDTKNPANGNYITGLDNTKWDKDHVTENRAATEGQLRDIAGSITNQTQGGGFALTSDEKGDDKIVKQDLGKAIQIKGDTTYKTDGSVEKAGNIKTSIDNGAIKVGLNKDVDLGNDGSVKAGNTTIDKDGVETNKVKVGDITITDQGIDGGRKQITNIASGIDGNQYADDGDNNAASIGDVKQLAQQEAQASEARSGKNITVKEHTVNLNDDITLGNDATKQVTVKGSEGQVTIGSGDKTLALGQQANGAGDKNPATGNFLNGLDNRNWDGEHIQNGRAATEDQLKTVSDKVKSGRVFQGDDGHNVTVGLGDTLKIQGGARDVSSDNNIGIVKGADDTLQVRLAKDVTGLNSVTTGNTTINN
ncbi:hypothetical protein, partial [Acidaminococcus timonensis]|uniref:hypothetical protein n=1 Tax=Acidaminococcus timonensis TaxID=1871002 RepID=UPI00345D977C